MKSRTIFAYEMKTNRKIDESDYGPTDITIKQTLSFSTKTNGNDIHDL